MKDKNTIIIIDIVLIVVAVALGIFLVVLSNGNSSSESQESQNFKFTTEDVIVNVDDTLMTEYTADKLGIKIKHYNELTKISETSEESSMYKGLAMYREEGNEGINILIGSVANETTFDNYIAANVSAIMDSNSLTEEDIVVIKEGVKLGGIDAFKMRYKMDDINIYQIATIKDSKEYVVTYSAEDTYYDKQKADNMFSTFEFIN